MAFWMAWPLRSDWRPLELDEVDMARSDTDWDARSVPGGSGKKERNGQ